MSSASNAFPVKIKTMILAMQMNSEILSVFDQPPTPSGIARMNIAKHPIASAIGTQIASLVPVSFTPNNMIAVDRAQMNQLARFGVVVFLITA